MSIALSQSGADKAAAGFKVIKRPASGSKGLTCWLMLPDEISPEAVPLVAVHGIRRGAQQQAELLAARAAAAGRPVIAPLFDKTNWPRYQQVVHRERADLALLGLMNELRLAGIWQTRGFDLAGYSGGAQFAHRFALLYPHLVTRLTVASAGWYTFPDEAAYPYGLSARPGRGDDWGPRMAAGLDRFLRLPIQVSVGSEDCLQDPNTRSGPEIDRQQGLDRVTRAGRWTESLRLAAGARGITPRIDLSVLPGCGHDFRTCIQKGGLDRIALPADRPMSPASHRLARRKTPAAAAD